MPLVLNLLKSVVWAMLARNSMASFRWDGPAGIRVGLGFSRRVVFVVSFCDSCRGWFFCRRFGVVGWGICWEQNVQRHTCWLVKLVGGRLMSGNFMLLMRSPNNQFKMDGNGETTNSYIIKIWNHPIETAICKWLLGGPGMYVLFCCWRSSSNIDFALFDIYRVLWRSKGWISVSTETCDFLSKIVLPYTWM